MIGVGFTEGFNKVIKAALRIAAGATRIYRADRNIELHSDGRVTAVSESELLVADDIYNKVKSIYLDPYGYTPPFTAEVLLYIQDKLEETLFARTYKKPIKVYFLKADNSGCGYWRCDEPARLLKDQYSKLIYAESDNVVHFETLLNFDVIVVQRGIFGENTADVLSIMQRLKMADKKIVYEIDDDLSNLLHDNNCFYAMTPTEQRALTWYINFSDAIFTTTEELSNVIGKQDKTYILPNSIDLTRLTPIKKPLSREEILFILWHGGDSHEKDINYIAKPLSKLIEKKVDLEKKIGKEIIFGFMGYFPSYLEQYLKTKVLVKTAKTIELLPTLHLNKDPNLDLDLKEVIIEGRNGLRYIRGVEVKDFHEYLLHLNPDIAICPLHPNIGFNKSKSNIKAIESIISGAAVVVSNMGPYSLIPDNVAIKARTPEQFGGGIQELILNEEKRKRFQKEGLKWVKENYLLPSNISMWKDALENVVKGLPIPKKEEEIEAISATSVEAK